MKFSNKTKIILFILLIFLNIIIRFQVAPREIGIDSFFIHVMTNSLSEFGYAKWYLDPLSWAGLYPYSYSSSLQFFLSGIHQSTNMDMNSVIFLYGISMGVLSIFAGYLMASAITEDDFYRILAAFGFSMALSVVGYSTWTIPTRGLLITMAPLIFYLLVKSRILNRNIILVVILSIFLFVTHHLFYFLLPVFFAYILIVILLKYGRNVKFINIPDKYYSVLLIIGFVSMFSIPFITGRFIEQSRYVPFDVHYARYIGVPIIFIFGGITYLVFKHKKSFSELFLITSLIFLTVFIYKLTYMKMFAPIIAIPFAMIGFTNLIKTFTNKKYIMSIIIVFLLVSSSFVGYYQFLHTYRFSGRLMDDSTYKTGIWMKSNVNGSSISNDELLGLRLFAVSESTHFLTMSSVLDQIYGFIGSDTSEFQRYPLSSDDFWLSGYSGPDPGNYAWADVNRLDKTPKTFNISYVVENVKAGGNVWWGHRPITSKLISMVHKDNACLFHNGYIKIWDVNA